MGWEAGSVGVTLENLAGIARKDAWAFSLASSLSTHDELLKPSCHHDVESLMLPAVTGWDARMGLS